MPHPPAELATPLVFALAVAGGGCAKPAAPVEMARQPEETPLTGTMTPTQQQEIQSAFESLVEGAKAVNRPVTAATGRWSDVYPSVVAACDEIEAAVVSKTLHEWGWEIHIRTVEEWPGTLTIRRVAPEPQPLSTPHTATSAAMGPRVICQATAVVGLYGDRTERAHALLEAFDKHLREFGHKRRLPDDGSGGT